MKNTQAQQQKKSSGRTKVWELGAHRLVCGNGRDPKIVKLAVGKQKVRMILSDPPYGVAYVENKDWLGLRGGESKTHKKIRNDQYQTNEDYTVFTQEWLEAVKPHLASYNAAYIFNSDLMLCALRKGMMEAGWKYSQLIIWIKNTIVLGRKDYNPQHELIVYGWMGKHKFERAKNKSVLFHPKPAKSKLHPTMKPVGLNRKLILDSTKIGDVVYDPFGGSGSTLIACEHLKRKCVMIEYDETYCDTIVKRWEKLTGKHAKATENMV